MPSSKIVVNKATHVTQGDVFDDLGLSPAIALEAKIKADICRDLISHIGVLQLKQKDLAARLDVHQPEVSNLLNGKISKFSVGTLIQFAAKLEMQVHVSIKAPKAPASKSRRIQTLHAKASISHRRPELERVSV